jgi:hypothetical protein
MLSLVYHWPIAFLCTQAIEIPIYLWGFKRFSSQLSSLSQPRLLIFIASMLTHPFIFLYLPIFCHHHQISQNRYYMLAETIAIFGESVYFYYLGFRYRLSFCLSLIANLSSATIGLYFFKRLILLSLILIVSIACGEEDQRVCEPATNKGCKQDQHCVINQLAVPKCIKTQENALKLGEICSSYDACVSPLSCVHFFGVNRCLPACSLDVSSVEGTLACQDQSKVESSCIEQVSFQHSQCISFLDDRPDIGFCISPCRPWAKDCEAYGDEFSCRLSPELPFTVCMPSATQALNEDCGIFGACKDGLLCVQQGAISKCAYVLSPDETCGENLIETVLLGAQNSMPVSLQCESSSEQENSQDAQDAQDAQENQNTNQSLDDDVSMNLPFSGVNIEPRSEIDPKTYRVCLGCEFIPLAADKGYLCQKPTPHLLYQSTTNIENPVSINNFSKDQIELKTQDGCYAWQALPLDVNSAQFNALKILMKSQLIAPPKSLEMQTRNGQSIWLNGISLLNENNQLKWYGIQKNNDDFEVVEITNIDLTEDPTINLTQELPKAQIGTCLSFDLLSQEVKALPCTAKALHFCIQPILPQHN